MRCAYSGAFVSFFISLCSTMALGQPANAPSIPGDLRQKATLSDEERGALRDWLRERVTLMLSDNALGASGAASELRSAQEGATPAFREALASALLESVRTSYRDAPLAGAARVVALVAAMNSTSALPVLLEALRDERAAVRTAAAVGLRNLRAAVAQQGGAALTEMIAALREAGRKETSSATLRAIYEALNLAGASGTPPEPRALIGALLDILAARAALYENETLTAESAETTAIAILGNLRRVMNDEEKKNYAASLARILRRASLSYAAGLWKLRDASATTHQLEQRNEAELIIESAEAQLTDLLGAGRDAPAIYGAMRKMSKEGDQALIKIELNRWAELVQRGAGVNIRVDEGG